MSAMNFLLLSFPRFLVLLFLVLNPLNSKQLELEIHAKSAILMNADTGAILFEKNAHRTCFPASITKIATALLALEKLDPAQCVQVSAESLRKKPPQKDRRQVPAYWLEEDASSIGLQPGEKVQIETLLHGLMLASGGDAANVLAEAASGSIPLFVDELNQTLTEIGCCHTFFCNPSGLHHPEHVTTAYDMALITAKALKNKQFCEIVSKSSYQNLKQSNQLLQKGPFFYSKAIGVKTGYHSQAQRTLVAAAQHEGRTLIAVLLGCEKQEERYIDAIALFETAFAEEKVQRTLSSQARYIKEIEGAAAPLAAIPQKEVSIATYPAEEDRIHAKIHWNIPPLPIGKGTVVGELLLYNSKEQLVHSVSLIAEEEVKSTFLFDLKNLFGSKALTTPARRAPLGETWHKALVGSIAKSATFFFAVGMPSGSSSKKAQDLQGGVVGKIAVAPR